MFRCATSWATASIMARLTDTSTKWRVPSDADLRWRIWEDEVVVFHPPSGDTHLLNPLAAEVLQYLTEQPADAYQLAAHLARDKDSDGAAPSNPAPSLDIELLAKLLADFDQLGLIEPVYETSRTDD